MEGLTGAFVMWAFQTGTQEPLLAHCLELVRMRTELELGNSNPAYELNKSHVRTTQLSSVPGAVPRRS